MSDEIQNLILQVQGEEKLAALNASLREEQNELKQLVQQLKTNAISQSQFDTSAKASAAYILALRDNVKELGKQINTTFSPQAGLQLSYILDDLVNSTGDWDRHLAAISNNIPGLAMSLKGVGTWGEKIASLAGPIGLVSTAIIAMAPMAKMAWEAMGSDIPKEKLDEIADAAKRVKAELDKIRSSRTPEAETTQKGFEDLFAGQGKEIGHPVADGHKTSLSR